jgi:hypothetical protein
MAEEHARVFAATTIPQSAQRSTEMLCTIRFGKLIFLLAFPCSFQRLLPHSAPDPNLNITGAASDHFSSSSFSCLTYHFP